MPLPDYYHFGHKKDPRRKLSPDDYERIRRLWAEGATAKELAAQFKVSTDTIYFITPRRPRKRKSN